MPLQWKKYRQVVFYAISLAFLLALLRWLEVRFLIMTNTFEVYGTGIAIIFSGLGIWLATKFSKPKIETRIVEKEIIKPGNEFKFNQSFFDELRLSRRELEVLQLMSEGLSNQEIADRLYVSLNTVKTHNTRLFEKMDVKRRTQAIEIGKKMALIP